MINNIIKGVIVINCDKDFFGLKDEYANKVIEKIKENRNGNENLNNLIMDFWEELKKESNAIFLDILNRPVEDNIIWYEKSVSEDIYFLYSMNNELKLAIIWQSSSLSLSEVLNDAAIKYHKGLSPFILKKKCLFKNELVSTNSKFRLYSFYKNSKKFDSNIGDLTEVTNFIVHSNILSTIKNIIGPIIVAICFLLSSFFNWTPWSAFITALVSLLAAAITSYLNNKNQKFSTDVVSLNFTELPENITNTTVEDQDALNDLKQFNLGDK